MFIVLANINTHMLILCCAQMPVMGQQQQQVKMKDAMQHGGFHAGPLYSDGDIGSSDSLSLAGLGGGQKADYDRRGKKK